MTETAQKNLLIFNSLERKIKIQYLKYFYAKNKFLMTWLELSFTNLFVNDAAIYNIISENY